MAYASWKPLLNPMHAIGLGSSANVIHGWVKEMQARCTYQLQYLPELCVVYAHYSTMGLLHDFGTHLIWVQE